MSARLRERLVERIRARGPITFAEYMEAALYDPDDGFFATRTRVGPEGDFVTSPHVSPVFGKLILRQLVEAWRHTGADPFTVVEIGAGSGALATQIATFAAEEPAFAASLRYVAVEQSAAARATLRTLGVETHATPAEAVPEPVAGCVLANELLDNLPFHRLRARAGRTVEVYVGAEGDRLIEIEAPPSPEALAASSAPPRDGEERPASPRALDLVRSLRRILARGYVFLFDYGFAAEEEPEPIRGYRAHHLEHDLLADPGATDITGPVDFDAVACAAEEAGFTAWEPVTQRAALMALGYRATVQAMRAEQSKAESADEWRKAIQAFGDRGQAATLVDPAGLGSLRLLALATPGLPEPTAVRSPRSARGLR